MGYYPTNCNSTNAYPEDPCCPDIETGGVQEVGIIDPAYFPVLIAALRAAHANFDTAAEQTAWDNALAAGAIYIMRKTNGTYTNEGLYTDPMGNEQVGVRSNMNHTLEFSSRVVFDNYDFINGLRNRPNYNIFWLTGKYIHIPALLVNLDANVPHDADTTKPVLAKYKATWRQNNLPEFFARYENLLACVNFTGELLDVDSSSITVRFGTDAVNGTRTITLVSAIGPAGNILSELTLPSTTMAALVTTSANRVITRSPTGTHSGETYKLRFKVASPGQPDGYCSVLVTFP